MEKLMETLIRYGLSDYIYEYMKEHPPNYEEMAKETAIVILSQLQQIFLEEEILSDDFLLVERILTLLHHYGVDTGNCHDF